MGLWDTISSGAGWVGDNIGWGNVGQLGLGAYSLYNQQQASSRADEYMSDAVASSREYFDWWRDNMAPLQQARSINELQAMGFRQDDDGNWALSEDVKDLYQTGLDLSSRQAELQGELFPQIAGMTRDQLDYQQSIIPQQRELYENQLGLQGAQQRAALGDIRQYQQNRGVEQEFYDQALEGIDVNERMGRAQADVAAAYRGAGDEMRLRNSRMGLNPASGAAQATQDQMAANKAGDIVGARSRARSQAEDQNFNRLGQAMNVRQRLGPAQPQVAMPSAPGLSGGMAPSGNAANAGARLPSGTLMQGAQMMGNAASESGYAGMQYLSRGLQGLSGQSGGGQSSGGGYNRKDIQQIGLQPVLNQFGW